ncbi:MAG: flagellin lysine-N-methylase [Clostridia bacterium]|nr:flagellin lysine-N-methylase [Clostridia bacterium]
MKTIYPDYYKSFRCTADKCRHNCCIGWEIDIDEDSLGFYQAVKGDFGNRLNESISLEDTPHFILTEGERCPFLNSQNLCDIFTNLGENHLCQICTDHPRFYNYLDEKVEAGLGLCCEEAARLIITRKEPFRLVGLTENPESYLEEIRSRILGFIQDRSLTIIQRIEKFLELVLDSKDYAHFKMPIEFFENLERLDKNWTLLLKMVKENKNSKKDSFDLHMQGRETEYEQFLCYLIYRHFIKADFLSDAAPYALFAAVSYHLIYDMGAALYTKNGDFTVADQLEIMRLFSSEIEYSDDNFNAVYDYLDDVIFTRIKEGFPC